MRTKYFFVKKYVLYKLMKEIFESLNIFDQLQVACPIVSAAGKYPDRLNDKRFGGV